MKGHIRSRGKGSWAIIIELDRDADGKRRQKWHTVHGTKKDAERELTSLLHERQTGGYIEPSKATVASYLDRWLQDYACNAVSPKTFERYKQIVTNHLKPVLGHYPLTKLQPIHIQMCYTEALKAGRMNGPGGLSARTVIQHHRILREALRHAVRWQLIIRNPADAVEPPKFERSEMNVPDNTEIQKLLQVSQGTRFYLPILLATTTGMRRGEIFGLRWEDVDLDEGLVAVRRSLEQTQSGLRFKEPKSGRARTVVLPNVAVDALQKHKIEQDQNKWMLGSDYQDNDLICAQHDGQPVVPDNFSSDFRSIVRKAEINHIRFHDLRHFHATLLMSMNIHPKVVSERLGHSTIGITLDLYSHCLPNMQEEAARRLDEALRPTSPVPSLTL